MFRHNRSNKRRGQVVQSRHPSSIKTSITVVRSIAGPVRVIHLFQIQHRLERTIQILADVVYPLGEIPVGDADGQEQQAACHYETYDVR